MVSSNPFGFWPGICREAESAVLLSCQKSDLYGFGPVWDHAFEYVKKEATRHQLMVVECTIMVDALELGDRYHMKKTASNIEVATSFITNILRPPSSCVRTQADC